MRSRQKGQALVAAMVVMLIVFALAGAVAIGASTLLATQHEQGGTFRDDLTVQSAVADAVAQVAGSRSRCSTSSSAALGLSLPDQDRPTYAPSSALCLRTDAVQLDTLAGHALDWASGSIQGNSVPPWRCMTLKLPGNKVAISFDFRSSLGGWAYVDKQSFNACDPQLPISPPAPAPACQKAFSGSVTPVQVSLSCQFATFATTDTAFLHIRNSEASPARVFTAHQDATDPNAGSLYLFAARTGVPSRPDYEEAAVTVDPTGATTLAYEGKLP